MRGYSPDLTGELTSLTQTCRTTKSGLKCTIKGSLNIQNIGNQDASSSFVKFYLSNDEKFDAGDISLKQIATGKIKVGGSKAIKLTYSFPLGETASGKYIIAVIDPDNIVKEIDETNNIVVYGPIE